MSDTTTQRIHSESTPLKQSEESGGRSSDNVYIMQGSTPSLLRGHSITTTSMEPATLPGTAEHLLALQPVLPLNIDAPEVKRQLYVLRNELTHLLIQWRQRAITEDALTSQIVSLIQVGPFQQWRSVLPATLYEIDRTGHLLPIWQHLIERRDPPQLSSEDDPTTHAQAYARRVAILLLGYYRHPLPAYHSLLPFTEQVHYQFRDLARFLGSLLLDPATSHYASQALTIQGTQEALGELLQGFKQAQDWPKIDILNCCLSLQREALYPLLLSSGLQRLHGLETYAAHALYRTIPLDTYLRQPHLATQAALILYWVFSEHIPASDLSPQPLFDASHFADNVSALFYSARHYCTWQAALALHELSKLLGYYWQAMQHKDYTESSIFSQISPCLPMMPEIEQWLHETGNDLLSNALHTSEDSLHHSIEQALRERQALPDHEIAITTD